MGVWIEITGIAMSDATGWVTPRVGVWIEIKIGLGVQFTDEASLPVWECGLK